MKTTKKIWKSLVFFAATALVTSCGAMDEDDKAELEKLKAEKELAEQQAVEEAEAEALAEENTKAVWFRGYLSSAFNISVDGASFEDSEDFYTQQLDKLEDEKHADGYGDYDLTLDAQVGLKDLKIGMEVFIESTKDSGFAKETVVYSDGTFEVKFPSVSHGDSVQIRANKRTGVTLKNRLTGDTIKWCYNFFAKKESKIDRDGKPVILRDFYTRITKYECRKSSKTIGIPEEAPPPPVHNEEESENEEETDLSEETDEERWEREWDELTAKNRQIDEPTEEEVAEWEREWDAMTAENREVQ